MLSSIFISSTFHNLERVFLDQEILLISWTYTFSCSLYQTMIPEIFTAETEILTFITNFFIWKRIYTILTLVH